MTQRLMIMLPLLLATNLIVDGKETKNHTLMYRNARFGFEISYPKGWKISKSRNGDGMVATQGTEKICPCASLILDEQKSTQSLKQLLRSSLSYEPNIQLEKSEPTTIFDSYQKKSRPGLVGYCKHNTVIWLITRDEKIIYKISATNMPRKKVLDLFKTFKITKGGEK